MIDRSWASLSSSVVGDHASCAGSQVPVSLRHCLPGATPPVSSFLVKILHLGRKHPLLFYFCAIDFLLDFTRI